MKISKKKRRKKQEWMTLVHVCRRWRIIAFQSPRRLNLRLVYTPLTPPRNTLDIWPPLPLIIYDVAKVYEEHVDYTIAALEHNNRVCQIRLIGYSPSQISCVAKSAAIQKPFPELTHLELEMSSRPNWPDNGPTIVPDSFLGGTTPRLQSLELFNISFPGLPKLVLSATRLVKLDISYIRRSGYIPPEAMTTILSTLTTLEYFRIIFVYPPSASESRSPPLRTRSTLPVLATMQFKGTSGYLEEILARIDAPRLNKMFINLDDQSIFDTPQLFQFISRIPNLRAPKKGHIVFTLGRIIVEFPSLTSALRRLCVTISCSESSDYPHLSSLEQVCTSSLPPIPTLEDLYILEDPLLGDVGYLVSLQLLRPFTAVKNLYLCNKSVLRIALALKELDGARMTEVLPTLENIFLEGLQPSRPFHEGLETFVAARRLTSHPVAVSRWDNNDSEYKKSFWYVYDL